MAGLKAQEEFDLDSSNAKQEWNTWIEQYDLCVRNKIRFKGRENTDSNLIDMH